VKTKPPSLNLSIVLSPSEASVLLYAVEAALETAKPFSETRLKSVRDKINASLGLEIPTP